ncbi:kinase-like domain-containing protein [Mycena maculata]|uniref:non-specific serine/threonine protein kinase n=1 Tax=Mycena maculata TaxID=230809 RepID=A0AAD7IYZ6_9AGAR|nr:kinase-like domain-containing protein [Mycena maculata]
MANAPPGSSSSTGNSNGALKRPLSDGGESSGSYKRQRERERDREPRDWRDVHLNRGGGGGGGGGRRRGGDGRRDSYARDRDRDQDRDRERDRGRERERDRNRGKDRNRDGERRKDRSPRKRTPPPGEREEGEISPRPRSVSVATPPPETPAPGPTPMDVDTERELDLLPSPPPVEQTLAERRARRAAILARHAGSASNSNPGSTGPLNGASPAVSTPPDASANGSAPAPEAPASEPQAQTQNGQGPSTHAKQPSRSPSPPQEQEQEQFTLAKPDSPSAMQRMQSDVQVNAADYDPSLDRREDEFRRQGQGALPPVLGVSADDAVDEEGEEEEDDEEDEVDDMFAFSGPKAKKKTGKKVSAGTKEKAPLPLQQHVLHSDTAADAEGYYTVILGEVLNAPPTPAGEKGERYQVYASVGRGMFAVVVRARVLSEGEDGKEGKDGGREVAIKIVRAQEVMHRAGLKESAILTKLQLADPEDKKHIVRLERTFEHRGHLCLVFESMSMNLRDVVKRFGKDVGLNIRAVRAYAHQLFIALGHLRKLGVMHADIKPDNILVNDAKTMLKLCDLGSASDAAENEITPYLVSRFYRAPEIILGVPYDPALDIWSIGCTLYELYTGKILFPGRSNNQMLLHMMELKGRFNGKMIKRAKFGDVYFDEMGGFESVEREKASGNDVIRKVHISKPARDLRARLIPSGGATRLGDEETSVLIHFVDLLDRCLALDPARRITPREALAHPFIRGATK